MCSPEAPKVKRTFYKVDTGQYFEYKPGQHRYIGTYQTDTDMMATGPLVHHLFEIL
jgi:hypothetical protein